MAAFSTIALGSLAALGIGAGLYGGRQQRKAAKEASALQEKAQTDAVQRAASQQRKSDLANARANAKGPDISTLLTAEKASTPQSTLLTGPTGVDPSRLRLGKQTLLGG